MRDLLVAGPLALALLLIPTGAVAASTPARAAVLTPESVLARIQKQGTDAVVEDLYAKESSWGQVLRGVRTGSTKWLQVARRLKQPNGAAAADLTAALADALAVAPTSALGVLGDEFDPDDVCSLNTLEDTLGESYAAAVRKVEARRRAVRGVSAAKLQPVRDECLAFLDELAAEVERNREEWFPKP